MNYKVVVGCALLGCLIGPTAMPRATKTVSTTHSVGPAGIPLHVTEVHMSAREPQEAAIAAIVGAAVGATIALICQRWIRRV
jgi:hypothetical protein